MRELVFLLEEESAKAMIEGLVPRLVPADILVRCVPFEGKQDLQKQLARRIRGYQNPDARFVVLQDQDSHDCKVLKEHLVALCQQSGRAGVLVRIACRELESFYLADLAAVEKGLDLPGLARRQASRKFRTPDALGNAAEELIRLTGGRYQKVSGSRAIGKHLDPANERSTSFKNLVDAIRRACA
jgi:hypothetical protein